MTAGRWVLPREVASAGEARMTIRAFLEGFESSDAGVDGAVLAVSELVTNAVMHSARGTVVELRAWAEDGVLHVEVEDRDRHPPWPPQSSGPGTSGRGLDVVGELSTRWGWTVTGSGKHFWCDLPLREG